ncbi:MAG TPA: hypothetical protein DIW80_15390, partial [Gordonia polyisoprenivorans]|nr:hypothetical protein [Gordonia polyisoprenivorans]
MFAPQVAALRRRRLVATLLAGSSCIAARREHMGERQTHERWGVMREQVVGVGNEAFRVTDAVRQLRPGDPRGTGAERGSRILVSLQRVALLLADDREHVARRQDQVLLA